MGVYEKQGAWWIDWYEGGRRRRKKTTARTKTEAKKLLGQVKAKLLPRVVAQRTVHVVGDKTAPPNEKFGGKQVVGGQTSLLVEEGASSR